MLAPIAAGCLTDLPGIAHGFFTRAGGLSTGIYASLNCGLGSRDDKALVIENRDRVARHLSSRDLVTLNQVHSADAVVVEGHIPYGALPRADGIVTRTAGLAIGVLTADCSPVIFADATARVIGAAHAGWRGAISGVLEATIAAMEANGARRSDIAAAIGPCINQDAYEVGPEFEARFLLEDPDNARHFHRPQPDARPHFDLPGYIERRLSRLMLRVVERRSKCTVSKPDLLFSYRRSQQLKESDYGRQVAAIALT